MTTPQERRRIRLANDHREMLNIQGPLVRWRALTGTSPHVDSYELTVNVRTIIGVEGGTPIYRDQHVILVRLPASYPQSAPEITMTTAPQPYHPNWFTTRRWCYGTWIISEGLGHHVLRMIRTLQFDAEITNAKSAANPAASWWYERNQNQGWFHCDRQTLPDPTKERFSLHNEAKIFTMQV